MSVIISIGGEDNYIVEQLTGPDTLTQNDSNNGNIIMKLGSTTNTSLFVVNSASGSTVFQSRGDKTTLFREEISIDNTGKPSDHVRDFEFKANNDADTANIKAILHYDATTPILSCNTNVMYTHTSVSVSDNTDKNYLSTWLVSGKIIRTCNTAVTDTLPTPSALVGAISGVEDKSSFCFTVQNNNTRETSTAGHFITIATTAGVTWDKNSTEFVQHIVPGQLSTYRIRITNATISSEAYTIELMGTQGERKSDHAIRYFSNIDNPITGTTLQTGVLTDLPAIIGQANFVRDYPTYTFFQDSGTNAHIVNLGPPCNAAIYARTFIDHEDSSDKLIEFNILKNGTELWPAGPVRAPYGDSDPGPFSAINYSLVPLDTDDEISISLKILVGTADLRVYSCQLAVYQIS